MRSDEAASNTLLPLAVSTSESITAGAEARGALAQFMPPQDEPTETRVDEGRFLPLALQYCPATLLGAISTEPDTANVCPWFFPAEDRPTATIGGVVEVTTDVDALLHSAGATAGISATEVDAETRSTTAVLAKGGPANVNTSANDETLETRSCPADVSLAIFFGEAEMQTDLCPILLADTPETTEVLTDGVSLFGTLPSWAAAFPATCTVEDAVWGESTPYLPLEGFATIAQAPADAGTQGNVHSLAATVPEIGFSPAAVEEVDQLRLEMLVREFNSWMQSMTFPVRKVEAGAVASGMRAGLIATQALAGEEPYLLVPESITLDSSKVR